jgi:hypothetical protein
LSPNQISSQRIKGYRCRQLQTRQRLLNSVALVEKELGRRCRIDCARKVPGGEAKSREDCRRRFARREKRPCHARFGCDRRLAEKLDDAAGNCRRDR